MSKFLANHIKSILLIIISLNQGGFFQGHQILDGIIKIHEFSHSMENLGKEGMLLKLDVSKTYDRVYWFVLLNVMACFGCIGLP